MIHWSEGWWPGIGSGLMALFLTMSARGQELGKLKPGKTPTDLLGGRLQITMPEKARVEARGRSIMAAPEAVSEETRVVLDAGKERLVLMAWELFARSGGDLSKAVQADVANWGEQGKSAKVEPLSVPKPLKGAQIAIPGSHDTSREAILPYPETRGLFLHLFLTAAKEVDLAALRAVIETLKVER